MQMVKCNVFTNWRGKKKPFCQNYIFLIKNLGLKECSMARHGIDGQYYSCPINQHVKNEKLHAFATLLYRFWDNCYSSCKSNQGWEEKEIFVLCCSL
jgi:hypothetical protein